MSNLATNTSTSAARAQVKRARRGMRRRRIIDAIDTVGADQIAMALDGEEPFGVLCRAQAHGAKTSPKRHAWAQLSGEKPGYLRALLAARGVVLFSRRHAH